MLRRRLSPPRIAKLQAALTVLMLASLGLSACTTPKPSGASQDDRVVGRPPAPDDDPFFRFTLPAEAAPAAHSGVIGDPGPLEPEPASAPIVAPEPDRPATKEPVAVAAPRPEPAPVPEPRIQTPPRQPACFSCVRICPVGASVEACEAAPENLICGWGTDESPAEARKMAHAQCEGALDLARQMPTYSRIEGACPQATCR
jgi:hypothetical protein